MSYCGTHARFDAEGFIVSTDYFRDISGFAESALLLTVLNIAVRYPLIYHVHNAGGRFASGNEISSEKI